ncbi:MAG TPA: NAD(P)/FAD-dependent oxidoreductase [Pseudomonadales bacterium]|nr:NAD(P)/FAD-dependent oxidoreductase [Pseudomonadales bacterium]
MNEADVLIIGAGPSGAVASALLTAAGRSVIVLEKQQFPRFSIGESLLPHCMRFIEMAGMMQPLVDAGYQHKNGAMFVRNGQYSAFDFREKFSPGWGTTYQVVRADFDQLLAREAERLGADVRYRQEILDVELANDRVRLTAEAASGERSHYEGRFLLDASGFGRVLPRLLKLDRPSRFPVRRSINTHVVDRISDPDYDRNKILIGVHPEHHDVWYWLIPFCAGRSSIGIVARDSFFEALPRDPLTRIRGLIGQEPALAALLKDAVYDTQVREISGYAADVSSLWGPGFALLGNAGEFLDPVFSSGVTIAMKSASLAAAVLNRQFDGETVDWEADYALPLRRGVDTFRAFVEAWYDGRFQDIVFSKRQQPEVKRMIASILAGYAWDEANPYVEQPLRRLDVLAKVCRAQVE